MRKILTIIFILCIPVIVFGSYGGGTSLSGQSLPWTLDLTNSTLRAAVTWNTSGSSGLGTFTYYATGAFDGSASYRIQPGTLSDNYYCLGEFTNVPVAAQGIMSIRWVFKLGPNFLTKADTGGFKNMIAYDSNLNMSRPMVKYRYSNSQWVLSNDDDTNTICARYGAACSGTDQIFERNGGEILLSSWVGQWICVEITNDRGGTNLNTMYVWTQDGTFNGSYNTVVSTGTDPTSNSYVLQVLGMYLNSAFTSPDSDTWMEISHVSISDAYQGPPSGFVSASTPTITGLKFQ